MTEGGGRGSSRCTTNTPLSRLALTIFRLVVLMPFCSSSAASATMFFISASASVLASPLALDRSFDWSDGCSSCWFCFFHFFLFFFFFCFGGLLGLFLLLFAKLKRRTAFTARLMLDEALDNSDFL